MLLSVINSNDNSTVWFIVGCLAILALIIYIVRR